MVDAHLGPVGFQLIGDDSGDGRADVLAHLGADDVDGDDPLAVDVVPDGGAESAGRSVCRTGQAEGRPGRADGDQEAASRDEGGG